MNPAEPIWGTALCYIVTWLLVSIGLLRRREYRSVLSIIVVGARLLVIFIPLAIMSVLGGLPAFAVPVVFLVSVAMFSGFPLNLFPPLLNRLAYYKEASRDACVPRSDSES